MKEMRLSVCIPTYEMHGEATRMLTRSFNMLKKQTLKDFEVVVSDNSEDDTVKSLCTNPEYRSLNINYFKNPRKGASRNTNEAMKRANGKLIKILHMDDYLADENSLQDIVDNCRGHWLVTGCGHDRGDGKIINTHFPKYNKKIYLGKNTIGSPSVLTVKNENPFFFDESLIWMNDCDYYERCYEKFGEPDILNKVNVVIGLGKHQTTNNINNELKKREKVYLKEKYKDKKNYPNALSRLWQGIMISVKKIFS